MVARNGEFVMIGNTTNPAGPVSKFTTDEWRHFVAGIKQGDFDGIVWDLLSFACYEPMYCMSAHNFSSLARASLSEHGTRTVLRPAGLTGAECPC